MQNIKDIRGENQAAYWNHRATEYDSQYGQNTPTSKFKVQRKTDLIFRNGNIDPIEDSVLEIGCGTGAYTREISLRLQNKLTAVDISPEMMAIAKTANPKVKFILMDARRLRFEQETFDAVISTFLLQHVDTKLAIPEIYRVLKPKGKFVAIVPNILNPIHYFRAKGLLGETSHSIDFHRWKWRQLLSSYEFTDIHVYPVEFTSPYIPESLAKISIKASSLLEKIPIVKEFAGSLIIAAQKK
jgi:ubiquinone/menaquinone biosynthesis C-methylase UbiE